MAASNRSLAPGPRASGLMIGSSRPEARQSSIRPRRPAGVPAMLVAAIISSVTARSALGLSPAAHAFAVLIQPPASLLRLHLRP